MSRAFATLGLVILTINRIAVAETQAIDGAPVETQTYTYKQVDDCRIQADVYRSPDATQQPAIVLIHGGGLIMGDRDMLGGRTGRHMVQQFVQAGFTVVSIDYRLAPETKLPAIIEDLQDAFHWLRTEGQHRLKIDATRLAAVGHSAGGYLSLMSGCEVTPPPLAIVSFYGYGDISADWYAKPDTFYLETKPRIARDDAWRGIGDKATAGVAFSDPLSAGRFGFYLYCRQQGRWCNEVAGYDATTQADKLAPFCPQKNVTPDYPPTLLIHGTDDTDVPYEQSELMAKELQRHQVEHELVTLKGYGHGFESGHGDDVAVKAAYDKAIAFLQRRLGVSVND